MSRISSISIALSLGLLPACGKEQPPTNDPATATAAADPTPEAADADPLAGREVVENAEAQPGDVTTCPYSGRKFEVKEDHPKVEYEGVSYWICSDKAAAEVEADPGKYLDDFEG